ncbi:glycosyl transferase family 1 [Methylobacterium sp. Leaf361]|uniref:glycosyl transferase family 1 n=1 Tax=Methylobacterium sp. Leaf361 TaxID=1736352 RepID=UPI000B157867|nr:glycosyl transferase family 1 [Methylobacterium sp. Leaf361]
MDAHLHDKPLSIGFQPASGGWSVQDASGAAAAVARSAQAAQKIRDNFAVFDDALRRAERLLEARRDSAAAAQATIAACIATDTHCGIFASPRLELLLNRIGRQVRGGTEIPFTRPTKVERVLHVATQVFPIGGHTKMLRRWIESDPERRHTLALTQQRRRPPADLVAAVRQSGGTIHQRLNRRIGGLHTAVRELRRLARQHDLIVLHIGNADVLPLIAFAETIDYPPILFVNHADHLFWIGTSVSAVVGGMRQAAMTLAEERRYVEACRSVSLPILIEPTARKRSRAEAKLALGLDPDTVLLVSLARAEKYRTMNGESYADLHVPLLHRHPEAQLIVVGAGERPDWAAASAAVGGRIQPLTPRAPHLYLEAADIYLDSQPFCSATSMMEASGYGLPCATRFVFPEAARICGMDHPGLRGPLIEVSTATAYCEQVSGLIEDACRRREIGAATRASVTASNVAPGWCRYREEAYTRALALPAVSTALLEAGGPDAPSFGEPDLRIEDIYGVARPPHQLLKEHLSLFPLRERLEGWRSTRAAGGFVSAKEAARVLLPEWMIRILKDGY